MSFPSFYVASTGQHVGKTTTCLGLLSGLNKKTKSVGFLKPIGQQYVEISKKTLVDKDVLPFKDRFCTRLKEEVMSPVVIPQGFTKSFIDGEISEKSLRKKIIGAYKFINKYYHTTVVEGTGHVGVGSVINLSNAQVASMLGLDIILIASGGLGSSFDAIALNKALCDAHGIKIKGVILNKVIEDKKEMIISYMTRALKSLDIPIIGSVPHVQALSNPTMKDFEILFDTSLLSGEKYIMRQFYHTRLVATSLKNYQHNYVHNQLIITPANREDIILSTLTKYWDWKASDLSSDFCTGLILTGTTPPKHTIVEALKKACIPTIYVSLSNYKVMEMITSYTVKIRREDDQKINEAISVVEENIDFEKLFKSF